MKDEATPKFYRCPKCDSVSHDPNDIANFYCGRCHKTAAELRDEEVTDFKHITDLKLTHKDCWTLALLALTDCRNPDARLVHGWIISSFTKKPTEHAWVEMPATATYEDGSEGKITVAIDYTQVDTRARIVPADFMYEKTGAHNLKRFTLAEAMAHAFVAEVDGPWDTQKMAAEVKRVLPQMEKIAKVAYLRGMAGLEP